MVYLNSERMDQLNLKTRVELLKSEIVRLGNNADEMTEKCREINVYATNSAVNSEEIKELMRQVELFSTHYREMRKVAKSISRTELGKEIR